MSAQVASAPSDTMIRGQQTIRPTTSTISAIRRKPKLTYQSPSSYYNPPGLRIEGPAQSFSRALAMKSGSTSSSSDSSSNERKTKRQAKKNGDGRVEKKPIMQRPKYSMGPPLPLYHPLGRLALSLPELDPATLGITMPVHDESRRSSARTRRPAAKLRDADEEASSILPTAPAATPLEVKEKLSPKKKGGARPGAGMKRKRKDPDEDATYPAKKTTRAPRGGAAVPVRAPTAEIVPPPEAIVAPATPESTSDAQEEKKPERRSTRARGSLLRRGSSASEATATSISASVAANNTTAGKAKSDDDAMELETPSAEEERLAAEDTSTEAPTNNGHDKDEGRITDETKR